jgi:dTMP kinase
MSGILVSLEGISGSGKTYFITALREELRDFNAVFLTEVTDRGSDGLDQKIIAALKHSDDRFFRMGLPRSETFLLLTLKICDYETTIAAALNAGRIVIEDRSIDTIAVYQSIMLCPGQPDRMVDTANEIYSLAAKWRQSPDITFLIEDEFAVAIKRAQDRYDILYSNDELDILHNAERVYIEYAKQHTERIVRLDRRTMSNSEIVSAIKLNIMTKARGK